MDLPAAEWVDPRSRPRGIARWYARHRVRCVAASARECRAAAGDATQVGGGRGQMSSVVASRPIVALATLALVWSARAEAQRTPPGTYANPIDIDYRYNYEQQN